MKKILVLLYLIEAIDIKSCFLKGEFGFRASITIMSSASTRRPFHHSVDSSLSQTLLILLYPLGTIATGFLKQPEEGHAQPFIRFRVATHRRKDKIPTSVLYFGS